MKFFCLFSSFVLILLLSGCASDPYTKVWIVRGVSTPVADSRINYGTDFLALTLPVSHIALAKRNDDLFKVQVTLENVITVTQTFAYKFEWFDRNGMVAPNSSWRERVIPVGGTVVLEASSPSSEHQNFRLTLRSAQLLKVEEN